MATIAFLYFLPETAAAHDPSTLSSIDLVKVSQGYANLKGHSLSKPSSKFYETDCSTDTRYHDLDL